MDNPEAIETVDIDAHPDDERTLPGFAGIVRACLDIEGLDVTWQEGILEVCIEDPRVTDEMVLRRLAPVLAATEGWTGVFLSRVQPPADDASDT